jgi:16S rRNA (cytosine967-C5)-methyltransferase
MRTARDLALATLLRGGLATRELSEVARDLPLAPEDRALSRELVAGVERRRGTLDAVIAAYVPRPRLPRDLRTLLRLGFYQLLFLERVPAHAAVDETVSLARMRRGVRQAGFVNAVLRGALREFEGASPTGEPGDPRRVLDVGPRRFRFGRDVFPDPSTDPVEHLAAIHSHPRVLVERWIARFGEEAARAILEADNRVPPVTVRVNRMRTTREGLLGDLRALGFESKAGVHPLAVRVEPGARGLLDSEPFRAGRFSVQDETAMEAVSLLDLHPGARVLDLCAAPGGKATQIAEALEDGGEVLACDVSEDRLSRLRENAERLGLRSIRPILRTRDSRKPPAEGLDRVLVDAPCSNTGVLARRPEARWRFSPANLREVTRLQGDCLRVGLRALRPRGRLVYSTCALEPEENGDLVRQVLRSVRGVELLEERFRPPTADQDGGYAAALIRLPGQRASG